MKSFTIHALELGPMENFVYLIHDIASKQAAVIDPAWEIQKIIALAQYQGFTITDVLLTHTHDDHINGLKTLLSMVDAQVHLLEQEALFWGAQEFSLILHQDNESFYLGKTKITALHTPGHTPGSACYYLDEHLITGDTLFINSCGRCDLLGGDPVQLFHSLNKIMTQLSGETIIHPGHHYAQEPATSLSEQIANNPCMQFKQVEEFVHCHMHV